MWYMDYSKCLYVDFEYPFKIRIWLASQKYKTIISIIYTKS